MTPYADVPADRPLVYKFPEPGKLSDPERLRELLRIAFGIVIADVQVCPHHSTPFRAFCDSYFARAPVVIWKAARGLGGKTWALAALGVVTQTTLECDVGLLGGTGEQSKRALQAMSRLWEAPNAPKHRLIGEVARETRFRRRDGTTATIYAHMASTASVRGPHPPRLLIDEVDEVDWDVYEAATGQPMEQRGVRPQMTLSSTHHYPDATFTKVLDLAQERGWPVHEWCWRESVAGGWLSLAQVADSRSRMTQLMWDTEVELNWPASEDLAIVPERVDAMFNRDYGVYEGRVGEELVIVKPSHERLFTHGADWAKDVDLSVFVTNDNTRDEKWNRKIGLAALGYYRREAWPTMIRRFEERVRRYGGASAHDATGLGDVIDDMLHEDRDEAGGSEDVEAIVRAGLPPDLRRRVFGEKLVGGNREDIFNSYIRAIENGEFLYPHVKSMYKSHRTVTRKALFGGGHPPDDFVAGALAYHARKLKPASIGARPSNWG